MILLTKVPTNPNYHNWRAQKDQKALFQARFRNKMNLEKPMPEWYRMNISFFLFQFFFDFLSIVIIYFIRG